MIDSSIFKSYDVRGTYPDQLNEDAAYHIGRAFVTHTKAKKIVIGYDARLSSPALFKSLADGIMSKGSEVYSIGEVPTECLYFAVGSYDFDAGIMITASHNPKEYNGFKMMIHRDNDIIWVRGKDLLDSLDQHSSHEQNNETVHQKDILPDYVKHVLKFSGEMKRFRIVVDASNGVIGKIIEALQPSLPVEIIPLNFAPDGNFPNHSPNPLEPGSVDQIAKKIKETHADFGFMFDGDADRIFLVDEQGNLVPADIELLLLAKYFLTKNPGAAIAYNVTCSRVVPEHITKWGGVPVRTAVGFVNVREGLIQHHGIMGGEGSAHYCFRDHFYMDSGIIAFLTLLQIISRDDKKFSELVQELMVYYKKELNFTVTDKGGVLAAIKEKYADGKQDFLDGVTVEYQDWWFNARPSNTEPLLRLTVEANTQELLDKKIAELFEMVNS